MAIRVVPRVDFRNLMLATFTALSLICAVLMIGCNSGGDDDSDSDSDKKGVISGVVSDMQGSPISGIKVSANNQTATTAFDGSFQLDNFPETKRCVFNFSGTGYVFTCAITRVRSSIFSSVTSWRK